VETLEMQKYKSRYSRV